MAHAGSNLEKNGGRKSRWTVSLSTKLYDKMQNFLVILSPCVKLYTIFVMKRNNVAGENFLKVFKKCGHCDLSCVANY